MTLAASSAALEDQALTWDLVLDPITITITIGSNTSAPLSAAGRASDLSWRSSDGMSPSARQQTLPVHVSVLLLPSWCNIDDLTLNGRLTTTADSASWKVISAHQISPSIIRIVGARWPS
jgi:hypothetical protein